VSARILTSIVESREDLPSPLVKSVASTIISDRKPLLLGDPLQMDTQGVAEAAEERFDRLDELISERKAKKGRYRDAD